MEKLPSKSGVIEVRAKKIDDSIGEKELEKSTEEQLFCIVRFRGQYFELFPIAEPFHLPPDIEACSDYNYLLRVFQNGDMHCRVLDILREPTSEEGSLPEETRIEKTA